MTRGIVGPCFIYDNQTRQIAAGPLRASGGGQGPRPTEPREPPRSSETQAPEGGEGGVEHGPPADKTLRRYSNARTPGLHDSLDPSSDGWSAYLAHTARYAPRPVSGEDRHVQAVPECQAEPVAER